MLNAKLADFAMSLEHAEEQIWRCWAMFQGTTWDGYVDYPRTFSIADKLNDVQMLKLAKEADLQNTQMVEKLDRMIFQTVTEKSWDEIDEMIGPMRDYSEPPRDDAIAHEPVQDPAQMITHFREMIEQGYTNEQILRLHPELQELFGG